MDAGYTLLRPEVPGGWGAGIVADTSAHPPLVSHLQIQFDGWLGDDLLTSFPSFFVTFRLAAALRESAFSGFTLAAMEVTKSELYDELHHHQPPPACEWLQIVGAPGVNDFGLTAQADLVVSGPALHFLRKFRLANCEVQEWAA